MEKRIQNLKLKYGTQMMSFPSVNCNVIGDRYVVSFSIDKRKGNMNDVLRMLESLPGVSCPY